MPDTSSTRASTRSSAPSCWRAEPVDLRPVEGALDVWRADLTAVADDVIELLCHEERARAERFARERDRLTWMRARGVLRHLLGRYLARDARTLRLTVGAHGKPALPAGPPESSGSRRRATAGAPRLRFNLSHSGHLALYAFTTVGEVGVDVEVARRPIDEVALAARAFGPGEAQRLEPLDPAARRQEFRRAWARHEATLKCRGTGFGGGPAAHGPAPWIAELDVGANAAAAVAAERAPEELRCWGWQA